MNAAAIALTLLLLVASCVYAQQDLQDVVYLRNGSVVRGTVIELTPGSQIRIQTADGSIFVFDMADVEHVVKEPHVLQSSRSKEASMSKSPGVAFALSFVFPGLGQYYNGEPGKGVVQEVLFVGGVVLAATQGVGETSHPIASFRETTYNDWYTTGIAVALGSWFWSMVDAPVSANRINRQLRSEGFGHLIEFRGESLVLGVDAICLGERSGASVTLHF